MIPERLTLVIAAGEGGMLLAALAWAFAAGIPLVAGPVILGIAWGIAVAAVLGAVNLYMLRQVRRWPGTALRHVCRVVVHPLFERARLWEIVLVSLLAGLGEEMLFRGVLQPLLGIAAASVLFGLVHVGGRSFVGYGVWASCIGGLFGALAVATGGLTAPVLAHAVYDALALAYVRFGPQDACKEN